MANSHEKSQATSAACTKCGILHARTKPWNGQPEDLCEACEQARRAEIERVYEHHERHPDECCCDTYLGRGCCMAAIHGDVYEALCIENGERFTTDFRAKNRQEALRMGREAAAEWGGECISVRKVRRTPKPVVLDVHLGDVRNHPIPEYPVYQGPPPKSLHYDRGCECGVRYANEITVPKRHSLICICPKCGCVTVD